MSIGTVAEVRREAPAEVQSHQSAMAARRAAFPAPFALLDDGLCLLDLTPAEEVAIRRAASQSTREASRLRLRRSA